MASPISGAKFVKAIAVTDLSGLADYLTKELAVQPFLSRGTTIGFIEGNVVVGLG
jgi:hypothetical protein